MTVAITLPGGVPIYAFSLLVGAGASLGLARVVSGAAQERRGRSAAAGLVLLLIALIGSRIGYQLNHPLAAVELPFGGLSWGGALLTGWAALPIVARLFGLSAGRLADVLFPLSATLVTAVWLGCWVDGCAYGPVSDAWYALAARDDWGNTAGRIPLQLTGAVLSLLTLAAADFLLGRLRAHGLPAALWLSATGLQLVWLQGLRADPAPHWGGQPLNLWAAWGTVALGLLGVLLSLVRRRRREDPDSIPVQRRPD